MEDNRWDMFSEVAKLGQVLRVGVLNGLRLGMREEEGDERERRNEPAHEGH